MIQPTPPPNFRQQPFDFSKLNGNPQNNPNFAVNARRLLKESDEPIAFLVQGLLQKVGLACLAGSSDTGTGDCGGERGGVVDGVATEAGAPQRDLCDHRGRQGGDALFAAAADAPLHGGEAGKPALCI